MAIFYFVAFFCNLIAISISRYYELFCMLPRLVKPSTKKEKDRRHIKRIKKGEHFLRKIPIIFHFLDFRKCYPAVDFYCWGDAMVSWSEK